jgi:hypothetical protein
MQTRRTAAAGTVGPATSSASLRPDPGKDRPELYAAGRPSLPGQRSAP